MLGIEPRTCTFIPYKCPTIKPPLQVLITYLMRFKYGFLELLKINMFYLQEENFLVHFHSLSVALSIVLLHRPGCYEIHMQTKLSLSSQ